jgi:hypothetical protein
VLSAAASPAKTMAAKPQIPLRIVIRDGRIVMYLSLCLRTRRNSFFPAAFVFDLDTFENPNIKKIKT